MIALVLDFGFIGRLKTKRRPEKEFRVEIIPELLTPTCKIPTVPYLLARVSPLAEELAPTMNDDVLPDDGPIRTKDSRQLPRQKPSLWNLPVVKRFAHRYPYTEVALLAL